MIHKSLNIYKPFNCKKTVMLKALTHYICGLLWFGILTSAGFFDKRHVFISSFKYHSCNSNTYFNQVAWVKEVDIITTAYGQLDVLGTFITTVNVTAPVKATVSLRRKIFGIYVPVPCIKKFGSCDYNDLCSYGYSKSESCPPILDEHDFPCKCPIEPGIYTLPGAQFSIPETRWAGILAGHYKGVVTFYTRGKMIACYRFFYTLE